MNIVDCFLDFLEDSPIDYSDLHTILQCTDECYRAFKLYALKHGFDEQTIKDCFYRDVLNYCKDCVIYEKIESLKEDFE